MKHRFIFLGLLAILFLCLVSAFLWVAPARAGTTITVNTTTDEIADNGQCSVREAVRAANLDTASGVTPGECPAGSGADTIILPSGSYTLILGPAGDDVALNGDLDITGDLTLTGAGADSTIVNGNGLDRVFHVLTATVQFGGITIQNGSATTSGGGLLNDGGNVNLTNSAVTGNSTNTNTSIGGGGVYNTATGTLTLVNGAVLSNTTTGTNVHGGGINSAGTLTLINTTLSGNQATRSGGGLYNTSAATLSNVTITNNTADSNADGSGDAGGIRTTGTGATVTIQNSLVADNFDLSSTTVNPDCNGTLTSQGYNLLGINLGCTITAVAGDRVGAASSPINPLLGPLQNNGGPTLTHAPRPGSPVIDAGNPATPGSGGAACEATDQRGAIRPNGIACDIGAYEQRYFTVNSTTDAVDANTGDGICQTSVAGQCTLRAAIQQANAAPGPDIVVVPPGVYQLTLGGPPEDNSAGGDLDILDNVQILGAGSANTVIDGGALDRVFHVVSPTLAVLISDVTIRNGHAVGPLDPNLGSGGSLSNNGYLLLTNSTVFSNTADFSGGGIANNGVLALSNSTVMSNTAGGDGGGLRNFALITIVNSAIISNSAAAYGGGLDNGSFNNSLAGTLTITGSTFTGNTSNKDGGGLYNELGTLALTNSTVTGNAAAENGGGLYNDNVASTSNLNNVTLTNNTADSDADNTGNGGGIFNSTGTVNLKNTIVAGNADNSSTTNAPDCSGTLNSQDYNLIQDASTCTIGGAVTNNKTGVNPSLGPLQENGGPTLTHALLSGSPAIDAGNTATCAATDQRNGARPVDGDGDGNAICDIGAYEVGAKVYWLYLPIVMRNP